MREKISRRSFLQSAVLTGAGAAAMGLVGVTQADAAEVDGAERAEEGILEVRPESGNGRPGSLGFTRSGAAPIEPVDAPSNWNMEADIVIVGTGIGGLSAALYCAKNGLSVIAVEKSSRTGGASQHAMVNLCHSGGTKLQNEKGFSWPLESFDTKNDQNVKDTAASWLEHYQFSIEADLLKRVLVEGAGWIDWLDEQDEVELMLNEFPPGSGSPCAFMNAKHVSAGYNEVLGNRGIMDALTEDSKVSGVEILVNSPCGALVMEGNKVSGIRVDGDDGEMFIKANKGVLLAAGGFGMNLDLLEKYIPSAYMFCTQGGPVVAHTGEVFRMGLGAGADFSGYNSFGSWETGTDDYWGDGDGNYYHYMWGMVYYLNYKLPLFSINKRGARIPHSFLNTTKNSVKDNRWGPFGYTMGQYFAGSDHRKYTIWDSSWDWGANTLSNLAGTKFEKMVPKDVCWGKLSPEATIFMPKTWEDDLQNMLDRGAIKKADTLEELEELCGFEPGVFVSAVERWNADCELGEDTECIMQYEPGWLVPIKEGPFYCATFGCQLSKTNCGLRVTSKMEVVDKDARVIPGLYASWSTAGGFTGENQLLDYGYVSPMGSVGLSGTSGFIAARALVGELG